MSQQDDNLMEQKPTVEFGYFGKRRSDFDQQLEKGFAAGFGSENLKKDKPATKRAAPKKKADASTAKSGEAFGGGPRDLSKLPAGLRKYWESKRKGN